MATLPPSPELTAFQSAIKDAWSLRSEAEHQSWTAQRAAVIEPPAAAEPDIEALGRVRRRAALSGWVDPLDLTLGIDQSAPHVLLDDIAASFDRSRTPDGWRWQMRAGARAPIFRSLIASGGTAFEATLADALADASAVPTDEAGLRLREIVAEGGVDALDISDSAPGSDRRGGLEAIFQALGWARIAAEQGAFDLGPILAAHDRVRRALTSAICASNCDRLLANGFYGYASQLKRLAAFATADHDDSRVPVLRIEGVGGAGKSTLLSALVRQALDPSEADPIIVQIDFDRLLFRNGGELELSFEVARQIGVRVPEADAALRQICDDVVGRRAELSEDVKQESAALESLIRGSASFEYEAGNILRQHGVDKRPLLLMLDTFEEWRRLGSDPQRPSERLVRLVDWLTTLKDHMGLEGLRVIVSGRVTLSAFPALQLARPVRLLGIGKGDATRLLRMLHLSREEAKRLLEVVGTGISRRWIPLTLHLAARMLTRLEPRERKAFLSGNEKVAGNLDEAVRQGTLYRRYLEHMGKGDVQKVALPGLALRRVTIPIIRQLLARPCKLGKVDEERAQRLFNELEREVWLVQRDGDALVHRADVRSVMVRMMADDKHLAKQVADLHRAAVRWYRQSGRLSGLEGDSARQEALYHELALLPPEADLPMLAKGGVAKGSALQADLRALLPARDDFGPRLAAQLRFAVENWVPRDEAHLLPLSLSSDYVREQGMRLVSRGDGAEAIRLYEEHRGKEPQWLAQAQVDSVRWNEHLVVHDGYVDRMHERPQLAMNVRLKHHVLRAFLRRDDQELGRIAALIERAAETLRQAPRSNSSAIIDTAYFLLVAMGRDGLRKRVPALPHFLVMLAREGQGGRRTFDDWLRAACVARAFDLDEESTESLCDASLQVVVAGMLRPDLGLLKDYRRELESLGASQAVEAVDSYAARLGAGTADSADLLFAWPAEATRSLQKMDRLAGSALLRLPTTSRLLLAGDPEMRPAIRAAMGAAFQHRSGFDRLGALLSPILPLTPLDFSPERIGEGWKRKGQMQVRLVEFIDRAGAMKPVLEAMCRAAPNAPLLASVGEGYQRWHGASQALAEVLAGQGRAT